jgi:hypothetical protein
VQQKQYMLHRTTSNEDRVSEPGRYGQRFVRWVVVLVPLGWGVYATLQKAVDLFR